MSNQGLTLLELMIAIGITVVVALLGFAALQTSTRSAALASARQTVQQNVRDALSEMTRELEVAASTDIGTSVHAIATPAEDKTEVLFQVPLDTTGTNWSTPITYRFLNEDVNGNGRLDEGEDTDGDGALTRRIVRIQDGVQRPVAAANDLSSARFELGTSKGVVTVTLTSTKPFGAGEQRRLAEATVSSRIRILN